MASRTIWRERVLGIITLWLGVVYLAHAVLTGEFSLRARFIGDIVAGTLFLIAGTGFIIGKGEIPEDTGENVFPRTWGYYLMTAGVAVIVLRVTAELLDLGIF